MPERSRWLLREGDEVVPGLRATKLLGGGSRYEAYLARGHRSGRDVVVKIIRPALVEDSRARRGLRSESELLGRLEHPGIVRALGAELDGPRPHLVLEHSPGPRLSALRRKYGPLPQDQLVRLAIKLCSALDHLAAQGVVHLDVKPSNVIAGDEPKLIDFSIARTVRRCESLGAGVGTRAYMSPEQCRPGSDGAARVGPAADIWGLGMTLYEAAMGRRPFSRGNRESDVPEERWPQLAEQPAKPEMPTQVSILEPIMACLERDPTRRPTARQVAGQFRSAGAGV